MTNKPLKYKIEIQLPAIAGKKPPLELYHYDTASMALYIFNTFGKMAQSRQVFEWDGKKYNKVKTLSCQLA